MLQLGSIAIRSCAIAVMSGVIATVMLSGTTSAHQQTPPPGAPTKPPASASQNDPGPDALSDAELAAALDAYAMVQAQQHLSIPDDKYRDFAARMKNLQTLRRVTQRRRQLLVQQLRRLVGPQAPPQTDDAAIRQALAALRDSDERAAVELRQAYESLDEVLDVRQQARFRLFEEQIERRKLDLLVRARERALKRPRQ